MTVTPSQEASDGALSRHTSEFGSVPTLLVFQSASKVFGFFIEPFSRIPIWRKVPCSPLAYHISCSERRRWSLSRAAHSPFFT